MSRVYLEKIELQGFKSFPSKTVIDFNEGITTIIGPNGCGKSNIVDAILWVFGEQKIKNLRGESNSDLIFNGSVEKKPLGMAEVGAYFNRDGESLYLARRFFRTGESKYILNENYCRHKDILKELHSLGLGGRAYFIFEQGSIEKMVSLKPVERRNMIEEAAGISLYLERKKECLSKLDIARQNLESLEILTAEKEKRLRVLKSQLNFLNKYRELKKNYSLALKAVLFIKYQKQSKIYQVNYQESKNIIDKEILLNKSLSELQKESNLLSSSTSKKEHELIESKRENSVLNQKLMDLKLNSQKYSQQEEYLKEKILKMDEERKEKLKEKENLAQLIDTNIIVKTKLSSDLKDLDKKLKEKEAFINESEEDYEELFSKDKVLKENLFKWESTLSDKRNRLRDLERKLLTIDTEIKSKSDELKKIDTDLNSQKISEQEDLILKEEQRRAKIVDELALTQEKADKFRLERNSYKTKFEEVELEIKSLQKQKNKFEEIEKKLLNNNDNDKKKVRDLVTVSKEYAGLVENFYYDELDAFIFQEDDKFDDIKANKILLNLSQSKREDNILNEEGVICPVEELIGLTSDYLNDYLKKGYLVNDVKTALFLVKKYKVHVITQEGILFCPDGLVYKARDRGFLEVRAELRILESELDRLVKVKDKNKFSYDTMEEEQENIDKLQKHQNLELRNIEENIIKLKARNDSLKEDSKLAQERLSVYKKDISFLKEEQESLYVSFEELEKQEDEAEKKIFTFKKEREALQEDLNVKREKSISNQKIFSDLQGERKLFVEKIKNRNKEFDELNFSLKRIDDYLLNYEKLKEKNKVELKSIIDKRDKITLEFQDLNKKHEELSKEIVETEQEHIKLKIALKEVYKKINSLREEMLGVNNKKNDINFKLENTKREIEVLRESSLASFDRELEDLTLPTQYENRELLSIEEECKDLNLKIAGMSNSNKLNFTAQSDYDLLSKDYGSLLGQKEDVVSSIEDLKDALSKIDEESRKLLKEAFKEVKENFIRNFRILFEGGEAELQLTDSEDVLQSGLEIRVQPPGKKLQSLRLLSGGEKTLTSLAFLFSLFQYKPSPFCVFDEVDASLDEANIQRFLRFLHTLKDNTQFLIITHNFKTMEESDYLYGISMDTPGISSAFSVKMADKKKFLALQNN